ncbi:hypothetical protein [Klebsiella oxytoca]|uniref:hypothetical protein n=1 Tax=Klebsiella oxytoca TaxID=571 RepID=UPI00195B7B60|nr:hypothetical protein [Klebsiella oxytoca]QRS18175.1 hypothetical protein I6K64_12730 [Klebsiella oxytoca]
MKRFFENWPTEFVRRLDILRVLDERGVRRRLYIERTDEIFATMASEIRDAVAQLNDADAQAFDIGRLYRYYKRGESGDALADMLIARIQHECERLCISPRVYAVPYLFFALLAARGEDEDAREFFNQMMRPLVIAYRFKQLARWLGRRGGGRPAHRLKGEAIELAGQYFADNPTAALSRCVQFVSSVFVGKYADPPANSTIRKWLASFYKDDKS